MGFFRTAVFKVLYHGGVGNILLAINRKKHRVPVLVFHKIIPEYDDIWPGIHPSLFENIILMLKKHYTLLPLSELYNGSDQVRRLKNACFITFDDGYKDFLDYAYPIMKRRRVFSTLFVLPYQITNKGHIWTSTIVFFTKHYPFQEIDEFMKEQGQQIRYRSRENGFLLNLDITKHLCAMQHSERMVIVNALRDKFVRDGRVIENELLNFDELRRLDPTLVDVGSHSLTHPGFSNETNTEFIESELGESKLIIERELNTRVETFAFPFANFNALSIGVARRIYRLLFTGIDNFVDLKRLQSDPDYKYDLPRFNIHHDSAEEVFFVINGFHRGVHRRFSRK